MRRSGYTTERAAPHDQAVLEVLQVLHQRGYPAVELPVDGHRPDIALLAGKGYVEVKTGGPNMAVETNSLHTYEDIETYESSSVWIVHVPQPGTPPGAWRVDTPDTVRLLSGPRLRSGKGSNDPWYLCRIPRMKFDDVFPCR